jgi:hypothetical protein
MSVVQIDSTTTTAADWRDNRRGGDVETAQLWRGLIAATAFGVAAWVLVVGLLMQLLG